MIKILLVFLSSLFAIFILTNQVFAQVSTDSASSSTSAKLTTHEKPQIDLTSPEQRKAQEEFLALYAKRPIDNPTFLNIMGYTVQYAVRSGVPINTIILILLLPALATLVVFARNIIGIPTLEMLVPIALSITLVATGIKIGAILLFSILFASIIARFILKRIRIMQLPKMALSMFLVSLFVFGALAVTASFAILPINKLSFLPVLLFILLSDKIVALELARGAKPTIIITFFTLTLAGLGFVMLTFIPFRNYILLYPETILFLIPINIIIGRYFGLRLTEYHRFAAFRRYVNQ